MMKKGFMVSVVLMLMMLLPSAMLLAQEKASGEMEKASCQKEMKLSDEQKAKIEELKIAHRMKAIDLNAERAKLALTFKQEWIKPEPNVQDLESIVKQLSAVREKIQLNNLQHVLAMRKVLGPDWRMYMQAKMGEFRGLIGEGGMPEPGEGEAGEGECCPMMREMMSPMGDEREERGPGEKRIIRIIRGGPGFEGRMMREGCAGPCMGEMEGMKGGCMMKQMHRGGEGCCSSHMGYGHNRMFRPFGRKNCCCTSAGRCMMHQEGMGAGCKGDMKAGCKGMSCKKGDMPKAGTCPAEKKGTEKNE